MARLWSKEVSRIEAFNDAVFALSATLLVVSLEVPDNFTELVNGLYGFIAFAFSFAMLIFIWSQHNSFFRKYNLQDGVTIFWNSILLFVILFYVYPLKYISIGLVSSFININSAKNLISNVSELRQLFIIYGLGFVFVFLNFVMLYRHALNKADELGLTEIDIFDGKALLQYHLIFVLIGLISILITFFNIGITIGLPGWIYGLLGPVLFWDGRYQNKKKLNKFGSQQGNNNSKGG
jgi:uncharacterized membrane protein